MRGGTYGATSVPGGASRCWHLAPCLSAGGFLPLGKKIIYFEVSPPSVKFCAEGAEKIFYVIATHEPFAPKARREFLRDSNTRAFCAEGAEKIFFVIATQELYAPKARRLLFSRFRKILATNFLL